MYIARKICTTKFNLYSNIIIHCISNHGIVQKHILLPKKCIDPNDLS